MCVTTRFFFLLQSVTSLEGGGTRGVTSTFSGCRCHAAEYGGGARDNAKKFGSGQCARNVRTAEHHGVAGVRRKQRLRR